ncbi:MAG TPA: PQQ-dependent sugar dehydrogenase, partial [Candidatus Limnocylindria bacterium]|nr:PQQ-dependent sugar dehydrogenase [Candidatus Limnocylindria bacterium]
ATPDSGTATPPRAAPTASPATPVAPTGLPLTPAPATPVAPTPASPGPAPTAEPTPVTGSFDPALALEFEPFAEGLGALTYLAHAGDGSGRLYALEQEGRVRLLEPDGSVRPEPFLDITDRVRAGGERGLLGLAFHPDYASNGRLFVHYTDRAGDTVVAEFSRASPSAADPASERVLLAIDQPFGNHNGGMIDFGPDGRLYVATGDGGSAGDPLAAGQDPNTPLGKLLRLDVDDPAPAAEIWALGLRNPWRFSFDPPAGTLWIADVGQNRWEEVNVAPVDAAGLNYGWSLMEGPDCFRTSDCDTTGLELPVAWYPTQSPHCAITGGYVYRGSQTGMYGAYLFSDYCSGTIWAIDAAAAASGEPVEPIEVGQSNLNVTSFGQDEAGELYLVGHDGTILLVTARPASPP